MISSIFSPRFLASPPGLLLVVSLALIATGSAVRSQTTSAISTDAAIESRSGGFKFPDGTVQTTAAASAELVRDATASSRRLSVHQGLYENRIPDFTHVAAFVEVCFKDGSVLADSNAADTSTSGGNCLPGDVGWILEKDNRAETDWTSAKAACLQVGMRLPEPFEFQFACRNAASLGLIGSVDRPEWMTNTSRFIESNTGLIGAVAFTSEFGDCDRFGLGYIGRSDANISSWSFRCAL